MDFNDTPDQAKFRATCREWLEENAELKESQETATDKEEFVEAITEKKSGFKLPKLFGGGDD